MDLCGQNGIAIFNASDVTVENNLVGRTGWDPNTGSWSSGINLWGIYGQNNVVRNNVSYHNVDVSSAHTDGNGMIVDLSFHNGGAKIENNLFFENGGVGIAITESSYSRIFNNTMYENGKDPNYTHGGSGLGLWGWESSDSATIRNNIVYQSFVGSRGAAWNSEPYTNSTLSNNNFNTSNPSFVDGDNADFRLSSSSPDIDAGTSTDTPNDALVWDKASLVKTSSNQKMAWYRWAPNWSYIASKGEVKNLFGSATRPAGGAKDRGAFEGSGGSTTNPPVTNTIKLRAQANNQYVQANTSQTSNPLQAVASTPQSWEQFEKITNADGTVSFKAHNGLYVQANMSHAGNPLEAVGTYIGLWEKFDRIQNSDGTVSYLSKASNLYVYADPGYGGALYAQGNAIGGWEKFQES